MSFIDISGKQFGRLLVLSRAENTKHGGARWNCACDCGAHTVTKGGSLRSGETASCGCLVGEAATERNRKHGLWGTREYRIWNNMLQRTTNENHTHYHDYGGRGIGVCDAWMAFECFIRDMGVCPAGLTLERVDNHAGYSKENCIWATRSTQARNTRRSSAHGVGVVAGKNGGFCARISVDGKRIHLGTFKSFEQACAARKSAEISLWAAQAKHPSSI